MVPGNTPSEQIYQHFKSVEEAWRRLTFYKIPVEYLICLCRENISRGSAEAASSVSWFKQLDDWVVSMADSDWISVFSRSEHLNSEWKVLYDNFPHLQYDGHHPPPQFRPGNEELLSGLRSAIACPQSVKRLMILPEDKTREIVDALDELLDKMEATDHLYRACLDMMRKFCSKLQIVPRSFLLPANTVQRLSEQAVAAGAFSDILKGRYCGQEVALKVIRIHESKGNIITKYAKVFSREAVVWRRLRHRNIVPFHGVDVNLFPTQMALVSDWMSHGNVKDYLIDHPDADRLRLILDMAEGLRYLHDLGIVHGDLKSVNILVDRYRTARIADFGLTAVNCTDIVLSITGSDMFGAIRWLAPEVLSPPDEDSDPHSRATDIYSFSMVMWEIFTGRIPLFEYKRDIAVLQHVMCGGRPQRPERARLLGLSDKVWALMEMCWRSDASQRPYISHVASDIAEAKDCHIHHTFVLEWPIDMSVHTSYRA